MMTWLDAARAAIDAGEPASLVTVLEVRGSAPREAGTKMLVTRSDFAGTIGGGQLEFQAIERARALLSEAQATTNIESVPLGPELGQCCGGSVRLLFEPLATDPNWIDSLSLAMRGDGEAFLVSDLSNAQGGKRVLHDIEGQPGLPAAVMERLRALQREPARLALLEDEGFLIERLGADAQPLWLFGAGHVGRALVRALVPLPFAVTWIDNRPDAFPADCPAGLVTEHCDPPGFAVERAPAGAFYLVMTHSHALDLGLCEAVLRRGDAGYLGLIGSDTKRTRFLRRLEAKGFAPESLARLTCPIGLPGIKDKDPAVIAASVAADLLQRRTALQQAEGLVA